MSFTMSKVGLCKVGLAATVSILCLTISGTSLKAAAESRSPHPLSSLLNAASHSLAGSLPQANNSPQQPSSRVAVGGTGRRSALPVLQSLLGQWVTNGGKTRYYIAADQITVINLLGNALQNEQSSQPSGPNHQVVQVMKYEVMTVNEPEQVVRLKVQAPLNWLDTMTLRLAPNRRAITDLLNIAGHDLSSEWIYVGEQQQP
jgi:hypothetical protein